MRARSAEAQAQSHNAEKLCDETWAICQTAREALHEAEQQLLRFTGKPQPVAV